MNDRSCEDPLRTEEELEEEHRLAVMQAFLSYQQDMGRRLEKYERDYDGLPEAHRILLGSFYPAKLEAVRECSTRNQAFLRAIVGSVVGDEIPLDVMRRKPGAHTISWSRAQENVRSMLRQCVRDWSSEGRQERDAVYGPVMKLLEESFRDSRSELNVLVPGAGLARLVYDITRAGFNCQGNEFSLFMLWPSEFILNHSKQAEIHPWILPFSNQLSWESQCRPIQIPEVPIGMTQTSGEMSMTAGDLLQVYGGADQEGQWDAIVTCFFLDTAKNVVEYLDLFYRLLRPGGIWINHGPLLYHFEGDQSEVSIELSLEEIKSLAASIGFSLRSEAMTMSPYAQDSMSMHQTLYRCHLAKFIKEGRVEIKE